MKKLFGSFALLALLGAHVVALAQPAPPENDDIQNAVLLTGNPATVTGSTTGATDDTSQAGTDFCGTAITTGGVWYRAVGGGGQMSATTCSATTTYDSKISVFSGQPGFLTCIGGNDDDFDCNDGILDSTVDWNSQAGQSYYILVHGFGTAQGPFELTLQGAGTGSGGYEPEPIPAASAWMIALLAMLLAAFGVRRVRRQ